MVELLSLPLSLGGICVGAHGSLLPHQSLITQLHQNTQSITQLLTSYNVDMTGFLDLPRELRDEIYTYYAAQDGGYVYNQRTRRLCTANRGPIAALSMSL